MFQKSLFLVVTIKRLKRKGLFGTKVLLVLNNFLLIFQSSYLQAKQDTIFCFPSQQKTVFSKKPWAVFYPHFALGEHSRTKPSPSRDASPPIHTLGGEERALATPRPEVPTSALACLSDHPAILSALRG